MAKRNYNNRVLAIIIALVLGAMSFIALLNKNTLTQGVNGLLTVCQIMSGSDYISQLLDIFFDENTIFQWFGGTATNFWQGLRKRINARFVGTLLGLTIGLAASIFLTVFGVPGSVVSDVMLFMQYASSFGGLGNRLGRIIDTIREYVVEKRKEPLPQDQELALSLDDEVEVLPAYTWTQLVSGFFRRKAINYTLGKIGGFLLGVVFCALIVALIGATAPMPGINIIITTAVLALFSVNLISTSTSAGGYVGRGFDVVLGSRTLVGFLQDKIISTPENMTSTATIFERISDAGHALWQKRNTYEGVATILGIALGVTLGVLCITSVSFLTAGLPVAVVAVASVIYMLMCISGMGGAFNRIGSVIDRLREKEVEPVATVEEAPLLMPVITPSREASPAITDVVSEHPVLPASTAITIDKPMANVTPTIADKKTPSETIDIKALTQYTIFTPSYRAMASKSQTETAEDGYHGRCRGTTVSGADTMEGELWCDPPKEVVAKPVLPLIVEGDVYPHLTP